MKKGETVSNIATKEVAELVEKGLIESPLINNLYKDTSWGEQKETLLAIEKSRENINVFLKKNQIPDYIWRKVLEEHDIDSFKSRKNTSKLIEALYEREYFDERRNRLIKIIRDNDSDPNKVCEAYNINSLTLVKYGYIFSVNVFALNTTTNHCFYYRKRKFDVNGKRVYVEEGKEKVNSISEKTNKDVVVKEVVPAEEKKEMSLSEAIMDVFNRQYVTKPWLSTNLIAEREFRNLQNKVKITYPAFSEVTQHQVETTLTKEAGKFLYMDDDGNVEKITHSVNIVAAFRKYIKTFYHVATSEDEITVGVRGIWFNFRSKSNILDDKDDESIIKEADDDTLYVINRTYVGNKGNEYEVDDEAMTNFVRRYLKLYDRDLDNTTTTSKKNVVVNNKKTFSKDYVFDKNTTLEDVLSVLSHLSKMTKNHRLLVHIESKN